MINYYTHGSQVTVSHGHLSFFGAYVLLNLTFFYFAIPRIKNFPGGSYEEKGGHWGFWLTTLGVMGMSLAFAVAGVLQTYLERVQGQPYMVAQQPIRFWMFVVGVHGLVVLAGVLLVVKHLLTLRPARAGDGLSGANVVRTGPERMLRPLFRPRSPLTAGAARSRLWRGGGPWPTRRCSGADTPAAASHAQTLPGAARAHPRGRRLGALRRQPSALALHRRDLR